MNLDELNDMELFSAKQCAVYFADRCMLLEQLCRDLYRAAKHSECVAPDEDNSGDCINPEQDCENCKWWKPVFEKRMIDFGLLKGGK